MCSIGDCVTIEHIITECPTYEHIMSSVYQQAWNKRHHDIEWEELERENIIAKTRHVLSLGKHRLFKQDETMDYLKNIIREKKHTSGNGATWTQNTIKTRTV